MLKFFNQMKIYKLALKYSKYYLYFAPIVKLYAEIKNKYNIIIRKFDDKIELRIKLIYTNKYYITKFLL